MSDEPRHEHDGDRCTFLGQWWDDDLYHCKSETPALGHTVIARHSADPADYDSGVSFIRTDPALAVAWDRAQVRGLTA
jgi:hypothetical protein